MYTYFDMTLHIAKKLDVWTNLTVNAPVHSASRLQGAYLFKFEITESCSSAIWQRQEIMFLYFHQRAIHGSREASKMSPQVGKIK